MKVKLLTTISLFTYQVGLSQTEKLLHGKVISGILKLNKVEVINKTAKTSTRTNDLGEFSILVRPKDSLIFFSKDYFFKRLQLTQENIIADNLVVNMVLKPEELDEVVITTIKFEPVKFDQSAINQIDIDKRAANLTRFIPGYKDGTIPNGMSLSIPIGQRKKPKKNENEFDFKKLIAKTCPPDFFSKDLKINTEEKDLFIEFCDADPKSKKLLENSNILSTMDFLYAKNEQFKKLQTTEKN
ncbi:hypothetical protein SGQ44_03920 [Flavobacterium sp. Fl-77]|uniref:CarboxypepD_reg-like domain-containing protein n=1 Tax=Flavobacterium flavipigmentatum TaxID=2893884 RepID=A0AAJ2W0A1_9FLAO|nr:MULTISPECIES: hypothetical protein [unclassified Flavobacterium]MDX6181284.1 hypothetical protein [Flavobacterium sp. Fl-33]MDX6184885.1 hypothetical protein [Flavobacterium sp. Fl-77]UFH39977.1 hypothetical protein LNP22_06810 [Flavobacterium sp. F-70]